MLTEFENFSITRELTGYLSDLNNNGTVQGYFFSRSIGLVAIPFTCLADAAVHISLCALKIIIGFGVSYYNAVTYLLFPEYRASTEFELSSSLIHVLRTCESLSKSCILPFLCVLNPIRANGVMQIYKEEDLTQEVIQA